jgi:hypothetical protein
MLDAIQLNSQSFLSAVKVQHIRIDRMLTTEFESAYAAIAQQGPEQLLRIGMSLAKLAREGEEIGGQRFELIDHGT